MFWYIDVLLLCSSRILNSRSRSSPVETWALTGRLLQPSRMQASPFLRMLWTQWGSVGPPPLLPRTIRAPSTSQNGRPQVRAFPVRAPVVVRPVRRELQIANLGGRQAVESRVDGRAYALRAREQREEKRQRHGGAWPRLTGIPTSH